MSEDQAMSMLKKIKSVMESDLVWFAYYKNKPIPKMPIGADLLMQKYKREYALDN